MVLMEPGHDGQAWWLCHPCWVDGATPWKLGKLRIEADVAAPTPAPTPAKTTTRKARKRA